MNRVPVRGWNETVRIRPPSTKEKYETFRYWLIQQAELCEITGDHDVMEALRGLEDALSERILDMQFGGLQKRRRRISKRNQYIAMFKGKYVELVDLQYTQTITGGECKGVDRVVGILDEHHLSIEEYLGWFFDEMMTGMERLNAPSLKMSFSNSFLGTFIMRHKELTEQRKRRARDVVVERDVLKRARVLIRGGQHDLVDVLKDYRTGAVSLHSLRIRIRQLESEK